MRVFKLSLLFFITALFITGCNQSRVADEVYNENYELGRVQAGIDSYEDAEWARENLDLQAIGGLLERADNAEEFEYLLNNDDQGINNLDLNGDGYADYISVREFDDRYDDERGFSLFSMFGPEMIQEIATIIFNRNGYNNGGYYPGSRILLRGNDQLYGDNYYYETNWLDRSVPMVDWVFSNRDDYYRSPYYYENYPDYYQPYQVVETTVYRTRINEYYSTPIFVQTAQPTVTNVKIVSPYREKSLNKIYSKLAKPSKEQVDFQKNNPRPQFVKKPERDVSVKENKKFDKFDRQFKDNPNRVEKQDKVKFDRPQMREKPNKQERVNSQPQNQVRVERQNQPKFDRQNQPRFEKQKQPNIEKPNMRPQKQENRGGGNPNKGGGGNPNKGGGGGGKKGKG